jgi:hypothetical protein
MSSRNISPAIQQKERPMKTRLPLIFTIILLLGVFAACELQAIEGSGQISRESRAVSNFTAVNFSGFGELTLVQGETEMLTIETDDNLLPYLKTSISQETLTISFNDGGWLPVIQPTESIRYTLTVKTLTDLALSGVGTIASAALTADHLTLAESGAGQITIDQLTARDVTVTMSGAGAVELAGQVTKQTVEINGLGNYRAGDLASQTTKVTLSGAGVATVWASERLDTQMTGAGTISYYGSPQTNASSSGIGKLNSLGNK